MTIDLNSYRSHGVFALSGKDRGLGIRSSLQLDAVDLNNEEVLVIIPNDIFSVNTSFFLGLFAASVVKLGAQKFNEKYHFEASPVIKKEINSAIKEALKSTLPIPTKDTFKSA